jgi:formylglycine-generating enzyme required for sulfatase activity
MRHSILLLSAIFLIAPLDTSAQITIDWSRVGNPGNAPDPNTGNQYGAVAYNYNIGKYDVTVGQYTEFLNTVAKADPYGLYNTSMGTDQNIEGILRSGSSGSYTYSVIGSSANLPITYVSWGDAARFANWLQNGQPTGAEGPGTTETGAYTLNGAITNDALDAVTRNPSATVFLPSENEWYKAAYYNPGTSSYYQYPFSSDTAPTSAMPGNTPNTANFFDPVTGYAVTNSTSYSRSQNYLTAVGAYTASPSPYGVFDMGGNVWQWDEALILGSIIGSERGIRGGSWGSGSDNTGSTSDRFFDYPAVEDATAGAGFRVASIPEPSSLILAAFGGMALLRWRRWG